jgi:hypothetical protein
MKLLQNESDDYGIERLEAVAEGDSLTPE